MTSIADTATPCEPITRADIYLHVLPSGNGDPKLWRVTAQYHDVEHSARVEVDNPRARAAFIESFSEKVGVEWRDLIWLDGELLKEVDAYLTTKEAVDQDESPASTPLLVRMSDVQRKPLRWFWPGRIPLGKITVLAGDPGLGKSLVTIDLAARASRGSPWPPNLSDHAPLGDVIILTAEDDLEDTVQPRLTAAGADLSRVNALQAVEHHDVDEQTKQKRSTTRPFNLALDLPNLEQALVQTDCRLVIIDPLSAYLPGIDCHKDAEVRTVLAPLAELAAKHDAAVVGVMHLNKGDGRAMSRTMGSMAFVAAARAVWVIAKDKGDPSRRLMVPIKCNLASDTAGLAYSVMASDVPDVPMLGWYTDEVTDTADDVLGNGDEDGIRSEAEEWLLDMLKDGQRTAKEIKQQAEKDGIKPRTLDKAKKGLKVKSGREGFGSDGEWTWKLPDDSKSATSSAQCTRASYGALSTDGGKDDDF